MKPLEIISFLYDLKRSKLPEAISCPVPDNYAYHIIGLCTGPAGMCENSTRQ